MKDEKREDEREQGEKWTKNGRERMGADRRVETEEVRRKKIGKREKTKKKSQKAEKKQKCGEENGEKKS